MEDQLCNRIKNTILDTAPDIWQELKKSVSRQIAEQLIAELDGVPSNFGKLIQEQRNEVAMIRRVA